MLPHQRKSVSGADLPLNNISVPCGLMAKSFFNDEFKLYKCQDSVCATNIEINSKDIAWTSDKAKFKNTAPNDDWKAYQWIDMTDPHFLVWMRPAAFPNFKKLYGKIEKGLKKGTYKLEIQNKYDVSKFDGVQKKFIITSANILGGQHYFLAVGYLVTGTALWIFAFVFCCAHWQRHKDLADKNN